MDAYRIDAPGGTIQLDLTDLSTDIDLYLADANGSVMEQSVREGAAPERIQLTVPPGTYYAFVSTDPSRASGTVSYYLLALTLGIPAPASPAAAQPAPVPQSDSTILFADNFDDPAIGRLPTASSNPGVVEFGYVEGEYLIRTTSLGTGYLVHIVADGLQNLSDTYVSADARLIGDLRRRMVSLFCRVSRSNESVLSYYHLALNSELGIAIIYRNVSGSVVLLGFRCSPVIQMGNGTNTVGFECKGLRLSASINGTHILAAEDRAISAGWNSFGVGSYLENQPSIEARFDNLVVRRP